MDLEFDIIILNETNNYTNTEHNIGKLNKANNNMDTNLNIGRFSRANKNTDIKHNIIGANNILDANKVNNIENKARLCKSHLF